MGNNNKTKKNSISKNSSKNSSKKKFAYPDSEQCHPRVGLERPNEGGIPQMILNEAAKILNVDATRSSIESALKVQPKHEYSFVKALPFDESKKNQILKEYVRPKQPDDWKSDPDKWLNSLDIDNVMNQYEEAY